MKPNTRQHDCQVLLVVFDDVVCFPRLAYSHEVSLSSYSYFGHAVFVPVCQVMHAAAYHTQVPPAAQGHVDPLYASVGHLLSKACSNTCFTAAQAFAQLVQPTARFQLALDALLPILDSPRSEVSRVLGPCCDIRRNISADMPPFAHSSVLLVVTKAPATNPCGIYIVFIIRTTSNLY
jgi:hypothetical protein